MGWPVVSEGGVSRCVCVSGRDASAAALPLADAHARSISMVAWRPLLLSSLRGGRVASGSVRRAVAAA